MKVQYFILILLIFLIIFSNCIVEDASINAIDAYSEIYQATEYKFKECGNKPETPFIPPDRVEREALRLCTISILRMECPFTEYPIFCDDLFFRIFLK